MRLIGQVKVLFLVLSLGYALQLQTYQRSIWNKHTSDLAIDNSTSTCYISGYDIGAWWFVDLGEESIVDGVAVTGALDAFQIRVGNDTSNIGRRNAVRDNTLCYFSQGVDTGAGQVQLDCVHRRLGRYVSVENVDPVFYSQMRLCNVGILYG